MEKENIFEVGDRVFDIQFGWGVVIKISSRILYPIKVRFDSMKEVLYTIDGKLLELVINPTLSFREYTLDQFTQKRKSITTVFREGDRVFDVQFGWGTISNIIFGMEYPIKVLYDNEYKASYTKEGKSLFSKPRTLSFTEYDWITGGASQDRKDIKQLLTEK